MKDIWILEDTESYRKKLEEIVRDNGFNPVSFNARNPFLNAYEDEDTSNIYGMILDNQVPIFDEEGCYPRANMGIDIIYTLDCMEALDGLKVALYTSDERDSKIEKVCEMGVEYFDKRYGVDWVKEFLKP